MINSASIISMFLIILPFLPQLLFILISGKRSLPSQLFKGRYLFYGLASLISYLALIVLALFFSNDYHSVGLMFVWLIISGVFVSLILVSWIVITMHGYEARYMFRKLIVPCYMNVMILIIYWITILMPLNYWAIIPGVIFTLFSLLWSIKAYQLTKPPIDEDVPLREDDYD